MTLDELNRIKDQLTAAKYIASSEYKQELIKSIWIINREIELKTKCIDTKYSEK